MSIRTALCVLAICSAAAAEAQAMFRCDTPAGVVYQQQPCAAGARERPIERAQEPTEADQAAARRRAAAARDKVQQIGHAENEAAANYRAMIHGRVRRGMTASELESSWGPPARINRSADLVQYVYPRGGGVTQYIYLRDGRVVDFN